MPADPAPPSAASPDAAPDAAPEADGNAAGDAARVEPFTATAAALSVLVAIGLATWGGWRWWTGPPERPAAASPTRMGVLFAARPVPGPESGPADGAELPTSEGLLVIALANDGAAWRSGVRVGDVWLRLAGQPLCDPTDPAAVADRVALFRDVLGPGFVVPVELLRRGEPLSAVVRDDAPPRPPPPQNSPLWPDDLPEGRGYMGVELMVYAPTYADDPPGVLVRSILPDGPADRAGVEVGDRLVALTRARIRPS